MEITNIEEMINSSDKESRYLAVSMLRYGDIDLTFKEKKSLINKVNIIDRINNINDIYHEAGVKEEDIILFKNPKNKRERYLNACSIIPIISQVLNGNWIPDFNDSSQYKYFPYFRKSSSGWLVGFSADGLARLGSGFYFETDELAKFAGNKFLDIYIDYLPE